ncbi:MAG: hypothetical protein QOK02_327 [Mycobacterium sp.]|nr:hypothetical protein [Mycobacterium sp.]
MADSPPHDSEDDPDDLAAVLDFSAPAAESSVSVLDALGGYPFDDSVADDTAAAPSVPLFTVTNPPGTVTVTTFMDGRVNRIDLSPKVVTMTETNLADEIVVIARLATQDARSAQYSFMLEGMREQGHDDFATHDFLTRDLDLPSPDQARAARAQVFATRYASNHD